MKNEKRLIDATALVDDTYVLNSWDAEIVRDWVADQPTVDAVEVVHGRWKYYHKQNIAVCTNCSFERNLDADFGKAVSCPNCGAKMDGGNEDG